MATFMSLPREIRELIYLSLLLSRSNSSPFQPALRDPVWVEVDDIRYASWTRSDDLVYLAGQEHYQSNVSALLRVNRQCYIEIKTLMRLFRKPCNHEPFTLNNPSSESRHSLCYFNGGSLRYKLDLCATPGGEWQVRWVDVPYKATYVDEMCVKLKNIIQRKGDSPRPGVLNMADMFAERIPPLRPSIGCILWSLLERYLRVGIQAPRQRFWSHANRNDTAWYNGVDADFGIGCLSLDIDTTDAEDSGPGSEAEKLDEHVSFADMVRQMAMRPVNSILPSEPPLAVEAQLDKFEASLCTAVTAMFEGELSYNYGLGFLSEWIGRVKVCRAGVVVKEWDYRK